MRDQSPSLKIVCFGDSLTLGYQSPTLRAPFVKNIPYGTYVQEWLGERGRVLVRGVCGETTQDMRLRFQEDVLDHRPQVAIILGGTNDLGLGFSLTSMMENLGFFYEQTQAHGILPVAVTVPSLRDDAGEDVVFDKDQSLRRLTPTVERAIGLRVTLNQSIKDLSRERDIPVVDWFAETCEVGTQALASEYSNDGLHLNTMGYRKLAELVWKQVLENLLK
ncbi:MAG: SGNH/GDSL hydrolase family protein [Nitrospirota bacterium]